MPNLLLTKEQIVETTGIEKLDEIDDLEILFLTFEEIASLESCRRLKRLCCIDNGLRKISNLQPVSSTLQILCLCDQSISIVDNLFLPKLRELYLHRNQITSIQSLSGCPKLMKLWLFQNQLIEINSLFSNLPDLQELWLQGNQLSSLQGFQTFPKLMKLHLAGNPIQQYEELQCLSSLPYLIEVSFNDFHFGRCPIVNDYQQYKSYLILYLKQIEIIDGVKVSSEQIHKAERIYYDEMQQFTNLLKDIDNDYYKQLKEIEIEHQSRESYTMVLEKEMATALKDLHGLVDEGSNIVGKEIQKNKRLLENNYKSFKQNLDKLETKSQELIEEQLYLVAENYQLTINILHLLELVDNNHLSLQKELNSIVQYYQEAGKAPSVDPQHQEDRLFTLSHQTSSRKNLLDNQQNKITSPKFAFQLVNNNTAEFHLLASLIDPSMMQVYHLTNSQATSSNKEEKSTLKLPSSSGLPKRRSSDAATHKEGKLNVDDTADNLDIPLLELAKLFKIAMYPRPFPINTGSSSSENEFQRVYCILSIPELSILLTRGWRGLKEYYQQSSSSSSSTSTSANLSYGKVCQVFSNDATLLSHIMTEHEIIHSFNKIPTIAEDPLSTNNHYWEQSQDNLTEIMKNILKHSLQKNAKQSSAKKPTVPDLMGKIFILVSFQVNINQLGLMSNSTSTSSLSPIVTSVQIPILPVQRVQMMKELELTVPSSTTAASATAKEGNTKSQAARGGSPNYRAIVVRNRNNEELKQLHRNLNLLPVSSEATSPRSEDNKQPYVAGLKPFEQSLLYSIPLDYCDSVLYLDFIAISVCHLPFNNTAMTQIIHQILRIINRSRFNYSNI